jgi:hypothetical protein
MVMPELPGEERSSLAGGSGQSSTRYIAADKRSVMS